MATEKVGIYRKHHGKIPRNKSGQVLLKSEWPKKRAFRWAVRWFGSDGKRYSRSFKTRKEAERFAENKQSNVRNGKADALPTIAIRGFVAEHEIVMRGQVALRTLDDQMRALKIFMKHVGKNIQLQNVTPRHTESFVARRLASQVAVDTVNRDIRTLKSIFNSAIEPRGYLSEGNNPFSRIKERKKSAKRIRYVSVEEYLALMDAAKCLWWRTLLSVAYTTGLRRGEILNLTLPDIDFDAQEVYVPRKGSSREIIEWEPRDHEARSLPVPAETMQLQVNLQASIEKGCPYAFIPGWRWKHIQQKRRAAKWKDGQTLINNIDRNFRKLRKDVGVAKCTLRDLRRTCITSWARVLPIHVVQKLAGHSDIKTTQKYYLAVQEDDFERAREARPRILRND